MLNGRRKLNASQIFDHEPSEDEVAAADAALSAELHGTHGAFEDAPEAVTHQVDVSLMKDAMVNGVAARVPVLKRGKLVQVPAWVRVMQLTGETMARVKATPAPSAREFISGMAVTAADADVAAGGRRGRRRKGAGTLPAPESLHTFGAAR